MTIKLGKMSPFVAICYKLHTATNLAEALSNDAKTGMPTQESHGLQVANIGYEMGMAEAALDDIRTNMGIYTFRKGVILGIHKNSPKDHFVVLGFIRGDEYPSLIVEKEVEKHRKTDAYSKVWFQETVIPKDKADV